MTRVESEWPIRSKTCRCLITTRPVVLLGYRLCACVWARLAMFSWTKLIFKKNKKNSIVGTFMGLIVIAVIHFLKLRLE